MRACSTRPPIWCTPCSPGSPRGAATPTSLRIERSSRRSAPRAGADAEAVLGKVLKKGLRAPRRRRAFRTPELAGKSLEEARRVIDEALVVGGVESLASYEAMAGDLYEEGMFERADKVFDEMCQRRFQPPVSMYDAKITALCGDGRADDAVKVLEVEMVEKNCVPTVRTYNLVMKGLCQEGKSLKAVRYLKRMDKQVGCVANKETYEILANGLCSEGRALEAAQVLDRMLKWHHRPESATFGSLIKGSVHLVGDTKPFCGWRR
uniref:Pentatricopeptide repeat-containing protein n=1 Tax=Ananas comosus var. bracteatus TaxID=296719 RepID=A0A6V7QNC3_ANACO|nr:unnamed protein product [Ananas comosus var. bracteatus]